MHFFRLFVIAAALLEARTVQIRILVTTDLHGNLYPYDYFTAAEAPRGLAKLATLIAAERRESHNALLVDCGDTIQGSPLESTYQLAFTTGRSKLPDPMMAAMNALRFDAMTLGNHELNYGLRNLEAARSHARFPWLSANTQLTSGSAAKPFEPYIVKEIDGVRVAIIGITTPSIPLRDTGSWAARRERARR
jgi:2',3'-cyclic-nucleotide 2'-phosphodiesterase / 3'-nucleotidase